MKILKPFLLLLTILLLQSCKQNNPNYDYESDSESYTEETEAYPDGTYSADVDYYNPDTGTRNNYTLNVDVESNEVVKIYFSSGWLDSSEFSSETLDSNGYCSITCYDGRQFDVQIAGDATSYTDDIDSEATQEEVEEEY